MATVHFKLKDIHADKPSLIYLIFSFGYSKISEETGKKVYYPLKYSTKLKIHPEYWNSETARVNELSGFEQAKEFNARLDEIEFNVKAIYRRLVEKNIQLAPWILTRELNLRLGRKSKKRALSFYDFAEKFIEHEKLKKKPATITKYYKTLDHLRNFQDYKEKKLDFDSFTLAFYKEFTNYLRQELKFSHNTIGKYIASLKLILSEAAAKGVNKNLSFKHKGFKIKREKIHSIILSEEEIAKIEAFDCQNERLQKVKDLFLLMTFSGLSYTELLMLDRFERVEQNKRDYLCVLNENSKRILPIHYKVDEILSKYSGLPVRISQQRMNEYLKDLMKEVFQTEDGELEKKYMAVSTDVARRSFAMMLYNNGIRLEHILYVLGFKQTPAFLIDCIEKSKKNEDIYLELNFFARN